jgi:hypothetical protein
MDLKEIKEIKLLEILALLSLAIGLFIFLDPTYSKFFINNVTDNFKSEEIINLEKETALNPSRDKLDTTLFSQISKPNYKANIDIITDSQNVEINTPFKFKVSITDKSLEGLELVEPKYFIFVLDETGSLKFFYPENTRDIGDKFDWAKFKNLKTAKIFYDRVDKNRVSLSRANQESLQLSKQLYLTGVDATRKLKYSFTPTIGGSYQIYVLLFDDKAIPVIEGCRLCDSYIENYPIAQQKSNFYSVNPTQQPNFILPNFPSGISFLLLILGLISRKKIKEILQKKEYWYDTILLLITMIGLLLAFLKL